MTEKHQNEQPKSKEERLEEGLEDTFPASDPPKANRVDTPSGDPKKDE
ncbi:hypothetical protein HK107_06875 [Parvularcula sp. ZS-1/3]|uniref:Uncharacterized protein n=1 Tax=Parvularcula mediterranea TaxID=2732508 RepID=A0A7Y3W587_9PROT|nr:hypothetical protein [Parvularcula mediterranea]NNU16042.1 hypothetical protein [Parvularcula mediterranea]